MADLRSRFAVVSIDFEKQELFGVALGLKVRMVRRKDHVEIEKTLTNPGEAIFKKSLFVRLKDQYKSECGQ